MPFTELMLIGLSGRFYIAEIDADRRPVILDLVEIETLILERMDADPAYNGRWPMELPTDTDNERFARFVQFPEGAASLMD